jgi:alpha-D-ribose 1-methylphosphonate 5-triphosphate synthase subunit PhnL
VNHLKEGHMEDPLHVRVTSSLMRLWMQHQGDQIPVRVKCNGQVSAIRYSTVQYISSILSSIVLYRVLLCYAM